MTYTRSTALATAMALATSGSAWSATDPLTQPITASDSAQWNQPQEPARIHGDTYYVGMLGLSSVLIHTDAGLIVIDADLPQSAPLIEANIRTLGFRVEDIKLILNSHVHFDHAGGIAALQRDSGATVVASPLSAKALRLGHVAADDPQAGYVEMARFPAATNVREIRDGEALHLGKTSITAHFTPGHTPGGTTWSWKSCEKSQCLSIVYADSLNAVASPGFHFTADATHADLTAAFRTSIHRVADLPCNILISVHPGAADIDKKLKQARAQPASNPFVDPQACRTYADDYAKILDERIAKEKAESSRQDTSPSN